MFDYNIEGHYEKLMKIGEKEADDEEGTNDLPSSLLQMCG